MNDEAQTQSDDVTVLTDAQIIEAEPDVTTGDPPSFLLYRLITYAEMEEEASQGLTTKRHFVNSKTARDLLTSFGSLFGRMVKVKQQAFEKLAQSIPEVEAAYQAYLHEKPDEPKRTRVGWIRWIGPSRENHLRHVLPRTPA